METTLVEIESGDEGRRLDRLLADRLDVSRARIRHLLEVGRVQREGRALEPQAKSHRVTTGERFEVLGSLRAEDERPVARPELELTVAAEGSGWLIVDKPAGRGVHPLRPEQQDTVLNAVLARHPEIEGVGEGGLRSGVVHRLDVDTSGALVFAYDETVWRRLRGAFADHRVEKRYHALVHGHVPRERRVDLRLEITRHRPAHVEVRPDGRLCRQHVRPLRHLADATLVEVRLETGFLHQIRASMAHLGHPVLGDLEYGASSAPEADRPPRQMLHAHRLAFEEIAADIDWPADFQAAIDRLAV